MKLNNALDHLVAILFTGILCMTVGAVLLFIAGANPENIIDKTAYRWNMGIAGVVLVSSGMWVYDIGMAQIIPTIRKHQKHQTVNSGGHDGQ